MAAATARLALLTPEDGERACALDRRSAGRRPRQRFAAARDATIDRLIALGEASVLHRRILLEEGRCMVLLLVLAMHATRDPADCATWPTLRRLQRLADAYEVASHNRVESIVSYFRHHGLVEKRAVTDDRRLGVLEPTARMWALQAELLAAHRAPLALLEPSPGPRTIESEAPRRGGELPSLAQTAGLIRMRQQHPLMQRFAARDSGYLFVLLLARLSRAEDGPVTGAYGELAQLTCVSRTQIRLLTEDAERQGLVSLHAPGGRNITLRPGLGDMLDAWLADHMTFFGAVE